MAIVTPAPRSKGGCRSLFLRILKWGGLIAFVLAIAGVIFQLIATESDRQNFQPAGDLVQVGGRAMHLYCTGEGSPTVILEAGGISYSSEWYWVQRQFAASNRVCSYDRAGTGFSEPNAAPRTAEQIADELHELLLTANVAAPYVLAGHSYGGILNRVYARRYPNEVIGIALVDSAILLPESFSSDDDFMQWKRENDLLQGLLWVMVRTGVYRLTIAGDLRNFGYPEEIAAELAGLRASNQAFDTYYAEAILHRQELTQQGQEAQALGALPLMILWATEGPPVPPDQRDRIAQLQENIATYSSNSVSRFVEGANHGSIIGNAAYAQQVTDAVRCLAMAVQRGETLNEAGC